MTTDHDRRIAVLEAELQSARSLCDSLRVEAEVARHLHAQAERERLDVEFLLHQIAEAAAFDLSSPVHALPSHVRERVLAAA